MNGKDNVKELHKKEIKEMVNLLVSINRTREDFYPFYKKP